MFLGRRYWHFQEIWIYDNDTSARSRMKKGCRKRIPHDRINFTEKHKNKQTKGKLNLKCLWYRLQVDGFSWQWRSGNLLRFSNLRTQRYRRFQVAATFFFKEDLLELPPTFWKVKSCCTVQCSLAAAKCYEFKNINTKLNNFYLLINPDTVTNHMILHLINEVIRIMRPLEPISC